MAYYRDGTVAERGDVVRCRPYNCTHEVLAQVVSLNHAANDIQVIWIEEIPVPASGEHVIVLRPIPEVVTFWKVRTDFAHAGAADVLQVQNQTHVKTMGGP